MLSTTSVRVPAHAAEARRAMTRALRAILNAALSGSEPERSPCFAVTVLDTCLRPVFASAEDLTPYGAELLVEEVCRVGRAARVDLFVGVARAAELRALAHQQIGWLRAHALDLRVAA